MERRCIIISYDLSRHGAAARASAADDLLEEQNRTKSRVRIMLRIVAELFGK
jgi:hypothetical protein